MKPTRHSYFRSGAFFYNATTTKNMFEKFFLLEKFFEHLLCHYEIAISHWGSCVPYRDMGKQLLNIFHDLNDHKTVDSTT